MGFLLFIISIILTAITVPLGMIYTVFKFISKNKFVLLFKVSNGYFYKFALSIDQMGNVAMQDLFNDIFIIKNGYQFGDEDETISSVLGKNERLQTLSGMGKFIVKFLNLIDRNHALNSIEEKP
jgi:hypothetical protein